MKTRNRQTQKSLPLAKELAGEVGLGAVETLKLVLDVPKSAAAPTDMAYAGRVVHPQLACALACICAYDLYSCGTANGTQIRDQPPVKFPRPRKPLRPRFDESQCRPYLESLLTWIEVNFNSGSRSRAASHRVRINGWYLGSLVSDDGL